MEDCGPEDLVLRGEKDIYCRAFPQLANQSCQKFQSCSGLPNGSQNHSMGLIRDSRLSRKHAELLSKRAVNPTIREKARKWLTDKQFWKS